MRIVQLFLFLTLFAVPAIAACLPDGIKESDVVRHEPTAGSGVTKARRVTVKQELEKLGARCIKGKLVDRTRREIRFFHIQGCWGNPPAGYHELLARQNKEIADMKKRYTVIEMTCNPGGTDPRLIV